VRVILVCLPEQTVLRGNARHAVPLLHRVIPLSHRGLACFRSIFPLPGVNRTHVGLRPPVVR